MELYCVCLWLIYTSFRSRNETELVKEPPRDLNVVHEKIITMFSFYWPTYGASRVLIGLDYCYREKGHNIRRYLTKQEQPL